MLIGVCVGLSSTFRSNPNQFSIEDLVPGIAAFVVGSIMVLLALVGMWRK
jgi:hypothetical protein